MSTSITTSVKHLISQDNFKKRFEEILGKKAQGFISSVIQISQMDNMKDVEPVSIISAAVTAATLDLPVNPNLGFAWIVPYKVKGVKKAQFQIGWKGFVQLAQRTGQYKRINVVKVYDNQYKSYNRLTEDLDCDFGIDPLPDSEVVGYAAYFSLTNGFEKLTFWSAKQVDEHAKKYSKSYGSSMSPWNPKDQDKYQAMGLKTVLKNTLSKYGVLSVEMQTAQVADQAVVTEDGQFEYVDNTPELISEKAENNERERILKYINEAKTLKALEQVKGLVSGYDLATEYAEKAETFKKD